MVLQYDENLRSLPITCIENTVFHMISNKEEKEFYKKVSIDNLQRL
jgi:hypothetical protein